MFCVRIVLSIMCIPTPFSLNNPRSLCQILNHYVVLVNKTSCHTMLSFAIELNRENSSIRLHIYILAALPVLQSQSARTCRQIAGNLERAGFMF